MIAQRLVEKLLRNKRDTSSSAVAQYTTLKINAPAYVASSLDLMDEQEEVAGVLSWSECEKKNKLVICSVAEATTDPCATEIIKAIKAPDKHNKIPQLCTTTAGVTTKDCNLVPDGSGGYLVSTAQPFDVAFQEKKNGIFQHTGPQDVCDSMCHIRSRLGVQTFTCNSQRFSVAKLPATEIEQETKNVHIEVDLGALTLGNTENDQLNALVQSMGVKLGSSNTNKVKNVIKVLVIGLALFVYTSVIFYLLGRLAMKSKRLRRCLAKRRTNGYDNDPVKSSLKIT